MKYTLNVDMFVKDETPLLIGKAWTFFKNNIIPKETKSDIRLGTGVCMGRHVRRPGLVSGHHLDSQDKMKMKIPIGWGH